MPQTQKGASYTSKISFEIDELDLDEGDIASVSRHNTKQQNVRSSSQENGWGLDSPGIVMNTRQFTG